MHVSSRREIVRLIEALEPASTIYIAGASGEPACFGSIVAEAAARLEGCTFTGLWIPGVNGTDYAALAPGTAMRTSFVPPALRPAFEAGRLQQIPLSHSAFYRVLSRPGATALGVFNVAPPDVHGRVSLGMAQDFTPALVASGALLVGIVNPAMPAVADGISLPASRFSLLIEDEAPLAGLAPSPADALARQIGTLVAAAIRDGDTVEVGIGRLGTAVLDALSEHRDLAIWGGLVTPPVVALMEQGAISRGVTTGIALGDATFYDWIAARRDIAFRPVGVTHDVARLADMSRFVAVNFVTQVDLFGQADAETVSGRQVSGPGGLADFARGALASPGGRSILALPSSGAKGTISRIVPSLGAAGGMVTLGRAEADIVVTEHGAAHLGDAGLDERAERLIAIADPAFRDGLAEAWREIRTRL